MSAGSVDDASVARFVEATSCADLQQATFFLEACGGNVDRAVQMYQEHGSNSSSVTHRRHRNIPPRPRAPTGPVVHNPAPIPIQLAQAVISIPFVVLNTSVVLAFKTIGLGFSLVNAVVSRVLPPRASRAFHNVTRALTQGVPEESPSVSAASFIQSFSTAYANGDTIQPAWQSSGWQDAAVRAHNEAKFLFVYLHSRHHQNIDIFCRDTLCNRDFVEYINSNFVVWGGDLRSADALRLSSSLRATAYPYCGLLVLSGSRIRLLAAVEDALSAERLIEVLSAAVIEHGALLWQERAQREQMETDRRLREEQDSEYQRSLEADRERERLAEEARRIAAEQEQERIAREQEEQERAAAEEQRKAAAAAALERRKSEKRLSLPEEPAADAQGVTLIRVRLPSGSTHQRKFLSSDVLRVVNDWVDGLECHDHVNYSLAMTYPRRVFKGEDVLGKSLEELDLAPQAVLLVQPEAEEEEEEEEEEEDVVVHDKNV